MSAQRFLITGGSQGIGAALVAHARTTGTRWCSPAATRPRSTPSPARPVRVGVVADVSIDGDNERVVTHCVTQMGGIDVLINNAGVGYSAEIGSIDMSRMRSLFGDQRLRHGRSHQPRRPLDESASRRRHRQHRLDLRHQGRERRHGVCGQQVVGARHQPVLAGRAAAARDPRDVHPAVGSPDQLDGHAPAATTRTSCSRETLRRRSSPASTCRGTCCGRSWRSSRTIPGRKTRQPPIVGSGGGIHIITGCLRLDLSSVALAKEDSAAGPSSGSAPWSSWPPPCGTGCCTSIAAPTCSTKARPRRRRCASSTAI